MKKSALQILNELRQIMVDIDRRHGREITESPTRKSPRKRPEQNRRGRDRGTAETTRPGLQQANQARTEAITPRPTGPERTPL